MKKIVKSPLKSAAAAFGAVILLCGAAAVPIVAILEQEEKGCVPKSDAAQATGHCASGFTPR